MNRFTWFLIIVYLICTIVDSYASEHGSKRYGKVLLMPLLAIILMINESKAGLLYGALAACWGGDLLLIHKSPKRNMTGMFCFLTGHVLYLLFFLQKVGRFSIIYMVAGIILYAVLMLFYIRKIWCHASSSLRLPSMVYMITIFLMSFVCFLSVPASSLWITCAGTFLFVISDILISDQLFRHLPQKGVMETYGPAQLLIVIGILLTA